MLRHAVKEIVVCGVQNNVTDIHNNTQSECLVPWQCISFPSSCSQLRCIITILLLIRQEYNTGIIHHARCQCHCTTSSSNVDNSSSLHSHHPHTKIADTGVYMQNRRSEVNCIVGGVYSRVPPQVWVE